MAAKMAKAPAFQFFPRDYLTDEVVVRMSLEQQGAYVRLLCHQWLEGSVPADLPGLAALCGTTTSRMKAIWPAIAVKFPPAADGRLANPRLELTRAEQANYRQRQSVGGKFGAEKRWGEHRSPNGLPNGSPTVDLMAFDSSASASASASAKTDREGSAVAPPPPAKKERKKRATPTDGWRVVPEGWEPKDHHRKKARELGLNFDMQLELFRNHTFRENRTDPDRTFTTWLLRAKEFQGNRPSQGSEAAAVRDELPRSTAPREGTPPTALDEVRRREREDASRADAWGRQHPEEAKAIADEVAAEMGFDPKWRGTPRAIVEATALAEWRRRVLEMLTPKAVA